MGGAIAQELVLNFPDRVNKVVLASTFAKATAGQEGYGVIVP